MAYFNWIVIRIGHMASLAEVELVKELFKWNIHATPR
jgi:hypothetical protein